MTRLLLARGALGFSLFLNVILSTPLHRLPLRMHLFVVLLSLLIPRQTRNRRPNGALEAIAHTCRVVGNLALCLLSLAFEVLLAALGLEILCNRRVSSLLFRKG